MPANSGITNFPSGFATGLSVRGMPLLQTQPGNVFWVDNSVTASGGPSAQAVRTVTGSDTNHGTFTRPFASIAYALSQCQQGNGDIIFVKPDHIEYVNGAGTTTLPTGSKANGTTLTFNCAGVAIIGIGAGGFRPTIVFNTAATANIPVRCADMSIQNFLFINNFAAIASAFTGVTASVTASIAALPPSGGVMTVTVVGSGTLYPGAAIVGTGVIPGTTIIQQLTGTAGGVGTYLVDNATVVTSTTITTGPQDFDIENCEFRDLSSSLNLLTVFTDTAAANTCDGFRFVGNRISSLGTTAATTALKAGAGQDRWTITDNYGNWAVLNDTACMLAAGANNLTQFEFSRNFINKPNTSTTTAGLAISGSGTAWTGQCNDNRIWGLNNTAQIWCSTGTKLAFNQNFCPITAAADKSGLINPAAV